MSNDDIDDRLSRRFGNDGKETNEQNEKNGRNGESEENDERDVNEENEEEPADGDGDSEEEDGDGWGANNVKNEWTAWSIYLPDTIGRDLSRGFKQMGLALDMAEIDRDFRKTRHFYPALVALGIERMGQMEPEEFMAFIDEIQQREKEEGKDDA